MCTVQLKRDPRFGYSARRIHIYVDGEKILSIGNGHTDLLTLTPGHHEVSFFLGKTLLTDVVLLIKEETENFGMLFWIDGHGNIEVKLTDNNIPHNINQRRQPSWTLVLPCIALTLFVLFLIGHLFLEISPVIYFFPIS